VGAVWIRLRAETRTRWRSWLGLAVLIGLTGGAAVAAAAGANRTETAYPRFVQAHNGYDLFVRGFPASMSLGAVQGRIGAIPEVKDWARIDAVAGSAILPSGRLVMLPELVATTDLRGRAGSQLNRFKVISGRMQDLRAPGEAVVDFPTADRENLRLGSIIRFNVGNPAAGPRFAAVRIVGIVASPGQFPAIGASSAFGRIYVTPAFVRSNAIRPDPAAAALLIKLHRGAADQAAFLRHLRAAGLGGVDIPFMQRTQTAGVQRSIRLESQALWVLCGLLVAAGMAIVGQALARQAHLESADFPALWALGMSRAQLVCLGIMRAALIGLTAAGVAVPAAILLSPLTPIGLARTAEPDPGFAVDPVSLILGAVFIAFLTILAAAIPAWAAMRTATASTGSGAASHGPARAAARVLSRAWRSPAAAAGVRMALQPGRGLLAVPVRSAIFGAAVSVAALTASLVFAASLGHLLETPRLSGFSWNAFVAVDGQHAKAAAALQSDPKIDGYTRAGFTGVRIGDIKIMALALGNQGPAQPVITEGTIPDAVDEIALGAATMRAAHTAIGQTVKLVPGQAGKQARPVRMRVVSTVIVPPNPYQATRPGEGAVMTLPALTRIDPSATAQPDSLPFLVHFAPGVSREAGLAALTHDVNHLPAPWIVAAERPANVTSLATIAGIPVLMAGLLALLGAGTLTHAVFSSTRRRSHDLAILKTLGFIRRQIRHAITWQATTIAAIALLIGLPAGVAGSRFMWRILATQLAVLPEPAAPLAAIFVVVPSALALAALIAVPPGRAAARTPPAALLRTE
jgi:FtsX-like permease family